MDAVVRQLQFFDPVAREYVPTFERADGDHARSIANGRAWRICRADRPLKPKLNRRHSTASARTIAEVQTAYLIWARTAGVESVTMYSNHPARNLIEDTRETRRDGTANTMIFPGPVRYVSDDEHFAVEHIEE